MVRSYFGQGFEESGPTKFFYTRDHLGSVREVVASDGTTVASRLSYDPWGKSTETGAGAKTDFTYTGHHYDRATGLSLAKYRGYDPSLGRWISRDPAGLRGGLNLYGYVGNDPVNYIDPTGKVAVVPIIIAVVVITAFVLEMGMSAPSDTKGAPADILGMSMAVAGGLPGTCGGGAAGFGARLSSAEGAGGAMSATGPIRVSGKGLAIVEEHLGQFGPYAPNEAMVGGLRDAMSAGNRVSGAEANFYLHELNEATLMGRGMSYEAAHGAALGKYGVSPYSLYSPSVIQSNPMLFNSAWFSYWGLK